MPINVPFLDRFGDLDSASPPNAGTSSPSLNAGADVEMTQAPQIAGAHPSTQSTQTSGQPRLQPPPFLPGHTARVAQMQQSTAAVEKPSSPGIGQQWMSKKSLSNGGDAAVPAAGGRASNASSANAPAHGRSPDITFLSTLRSVCSFILTTEFCERLAFFSFQGTLVLYFTREIGLTNAQANSQFAIWSSIAMLSAPLAGWLADVSLGRYLTILYACVVYAVGLAFVSVASRESKEIDGLFWAGLYVAALATGGIKANASTLGADQFDGSHPGDKAEAGSFFHMFYWIGNLSGVISFTAVVTVCQNVSFAIGYAIPAIVMIVGAFIFFLGRSRYIKLEPEGSILVIFFKVIWSAYRAGKGDELIEHFEIKHWLDRAKKSSGGKYTTQEVEDAKYVLRLFPFLTSLAFYWFVYYQASTTFFNQGCQMNLTVGKNGYTFPVASLYLISILVVVVCIPLFDRSLYPTMQRRGYGMKLRTRMQVGILFAMLSMLCAGGVETARLQRASNPDNLGTASPCFSTATDIPTVDMSIFWQIPQYFFIGVSEVMMAVSALEFFYRQAPVSMRSVCAGLNLFSQAIGLWILAIVQPIVNAGQTDWLATDLNQGHLDFYFWTLAAVSFLTALQLRYVSKNFIKADLVTAEEDVDPLEADEQLKTRIHNPELVFATAGATHPVTAP